MTLPTQNAKIIKNGGLNMSLWQLWGILGVIFVIIEMFTPFLFFLNLAIASFITASIVYVFNIDFQVQLVLFSILSFACLLCIRPLLLKNKKSQAQTGIDAKYIGKDAKVVRKINKEGGRISIYGEEWNAKSHTEEEIEENEMVKIVSNDGLIMIVKKI